MRRFGLAVTVVTVMIHHLGGHVHAMHISVCLCVYDVMMLKQEACDHSSQCYIAEVARINAWMRFLVSSLDYGVNALLTVLKIMMCWITYRHKKVWGEGGKLFWFGGETSPPPVD